MFYELSSCSNSKHERIECSGPLAELSSLLQEWKKFSYEVEHKMCF